MSEMEMRVTPEANGTRHDLMQDEQSLSCLWIVDLWMRIGTASVRMGGIAGVGTDRAHRNKGYARRVLEHSAQWMQENGYDCAVLFGIPDFYDKFGYAGCLPVSRFEVKTRDAERTEKKLAVRPFSPEDLPALRAIYAENNALLTGSIARTEQTNWFQKGSWYGEPAEAFVFTESDGTLVAYAARDRSKEAVKVCEVGARRPEHYADIVRWAAERAIELRVENVVFLAPPDGLFRAALLPFGAKQTLEFARCAGGMGRLIHLTTFMEKTLPEWTRRAADVRPLEPGLSLQFVTDIGRVTLRWTGEEIITDDAAQPSGTVHLPQHRLMQMAMGYYGAETVLTFPEVQAEGDLRLLWPLFPQRLAHMWVTDHF